VTTTTSPRFLQPFKGDSLKARRSPASVWGAAALLAAALSVLPATPAAAHSALLSTDPADGATLSTAPTQVSLVFNEDVAPQFVDGAITVGTAPATAVTAAVDAGTVVLAVPDELIQDSATQPWRVDHRVVSADGHPISGSVSFTVEAAPAAVAPVAPPATSTTTAAPTPSSASASNGASASPSPSISTEAAHAEIGRGGVGSSVVVVGTGLAALLGAILGTVIVLVRRRRQDARARRSPAVPTADASRGRRP